MTALRAAFALAIKPFTLQFSSTVQETTADQPTIFNIPPAALMLSHAVNSKPA